MKTAKEMYKLNRFKEKQYNSVLNRRIDEFIQSDEFKSMADEINDKIHDAVNNNEFKTEFLINYDKYDFYKNDPTYETTQVIEGALYREYQDKLGYDVSLLVFQPEDRMMENINGNYFKFCWYMLDSEIEAEENIANKNNKNIFSIIMIFLTIIWVISMAIIILYY